MNIFEQAIVESKIERAQNDIREEHNDLESKKLVGKKNFFPYKSEKFIAMVNLFREKYEEK